MNTLHPEPVRGLHQFAKSVRRQLLTDALAGTSRDRLSYAIARANNRAICDLGLFGSCTIDTDQTARLAIRWYERLERLAKTFPHHQPQ